MSHERETFILRWWPVLISVVGAIIVLISTISVGATLLYRFNLVESQQREAKATTEAQFLQIMLKIESFQVSIGQDKLSIAILQQQIADNKEDVKNLKEKVEKYIK